MTGETAVDFGEPGSSADTGGPPSALPTYPVEAFAWGGLTSGNWSRALWFLLLPFALGNMAGWMHDSHPDGAPGSDSRTRAPFSKSLSLMFGLTMTLIPVWIAFYVAVDLVAYRCGWLSGACRQSVFGLTTATDLASSDLGPFPAGPGLVIVAASFVPLLVLTLLWWVGRPSFKLYEQANPDPVGAVGDPGLDAGLASRRFWQGGEPVRRLRSIHWTVGLVGLQLALASTLVGTSTANGPWMASLIAFGLVLLVVSFWLVRLPRTHDREADPPGSRDHTRWLRRAAWVLLGATAAFRLYAEGVEARAPNPSACEPCLDAPLTLEPLPGLIVLTVGATAFQVALLLAMQGRASGRRVRRWVVDGILAVAAISVISGFDFGSGIEVEQHPVTRSLILVGLLVAFMVSRKRFDVAAPFWGLGQSIISALAIFAFGALWSGAGILTARTFAPSSVVLESPDWFPWIATSYALLLFLVLTGIGVLWRFARRPWDETVARRLHGVEEENPLRPTRERIRRITSRFVHGRMVVSADRYLAGIIASTIALATFAVLAELFDSRTEGGPGSGSLPLFLASAAGFSSLIVISAPVALMFLIRIAYSSPKGRRGVGSVWDVVTFFPRLFHPFAPPCYGERAVPQLADRIASATTGDTSGVVLRSHSQGTVLTVAALALQSSESSLEAGRVRVVTFGSPLSVLYSQLFPAYFRGLTATVAAKMPSDQLGWVNFWSFTDPLGTELFPTSSVSPARDVGPLKDPCQWTTLPGEDEPPILGHSTYWKHPVVDAAVARFALGLGGDDSDWIDRLESLS